MQQGSEPRVPPVTDPVADYDTMPVTDPVAVYDTMPVTDPVAVYDMMMEAKSRLMGLFLSLHPDEADDQGVVEFCADLTARVDAVDPDDLAAQHQTSARLRNEHRALGGH